MASAQTDTLFYAIDSVASVGAVRRTSVVGGDLSGTLTLDMDRMSSMPKILGSADPLRSASFLPGVQTSSEYDSGVHICGCENAHNDINIKGVPVYGAAHLFGFFSIFNPAHYKSMDFSLTESKADRLGGSLGMVLQDKIPSKAGGDFNVGIMSSQGTLRLPLGRRNALTVSGRGSYMNLLYGKFMRFDDSDVRYGFGDANITWQCNASERDRLWLDLYYGRDNAKVEDGTDFCGINVRWGNKIASLHWQHEMERASLRQSIYGSRYSSKADIGYQDILAHLNSGISTFGYDADVTLGDFNFGASAQMHRIQEQIPAFNDVQPSNRPETSAIGELYGEWSHLFGLHWEIEAGLKAALYRSADKRYWFRPSPKVKASYDFRRYGKLSLQYSIRNQYLFQTGLTNIGFPTEFWMAAGEASAPQWSQNLDLGYNCELWGGRYAVSTNLYYRWLYNQVEFGGNLYDLLDTSYSLRDCLLTGKGRNYGINLMFQKKSGDFTGWVSYSLGRSLRKFDNAEYPLAWYPSNHERIHELNVVASYKKGRWNASGTFVCASGTPFTAPECFYIVSGHMMTQYGQHNGTRLRPYIRLDLSLDCSIIKNERQENGINLSVYNVLCRRNDVFYRLKLTEDGFSFSKVAFFLRFVPSVSYYHRF